MVQEDTVIWHDIPGYLGMYKVTKDGRVKSIPRLNKIGKSIKGSILSQNTHYKSGYKSVQLCDSMSCKRINIHQIMCITFLDENYTYSGLQCNHIDGNKQNNLLKNLEIVTPSDNGKHAYKLKLNIPSPQKGEAHGMSKLTEDDVLSIYLDYHGYKEVTQVQLAIEYGVKRTTISDITRGKSWSHLTKRVLI